MDTECKICAVYKNIPGTWPEQKGGSWLLEAAGGCRGLVCPPVTLTEGTPQQSRQLWLLLSFRCSWKTGTGKGIKRERRDWRPSEHLLPLRGSPVVPLGTTSMARGIFLAPNGRFWFEFMVLRGAAAVPRALQGELVPCGSSIPPHPAGILPPARRKLFQLSPSFVSCN